MTALCGLLLGTVLGFGAEQRLGDAIARAELDRDEVSLSGELTVTLSIEGPAPVEVEAPRPLTQSPDWRVRPGQPKTIALSGGRERWQQSFRLEPFQAGRVSLPLEPLHYRTRHELRDWTLTWPPLEVRVTSEVADPTLAQARPVTGIDELPPAAARAVPVAFIALAAVPLLIVFVGALLWLRRRTGVARRSARDLALDHLLRLEVERGPHLPERLADLVRRYLEDRYDLAATRQTTAEFLISLREHAVLSEELAEQVGDLLRRGDLAKFAGQTASPAECVTLLTAARRLVAETTPARES